MAPMDYAAAIVHLQQVDPILAGVIAHAPICNLGQENREHSLCSALVRSIIYQRISTKAAHTIYDRFLGLYPIGRFPSADEILSTPESLLRGIGLPQAKVNAIQDLAIKTLAGLPDFEELATLEDEAIITTLTQIKGIGRWSVQMLLMFQLRRLDILPTADLGIRTAIHDLYRLDVLPTPTTVEQLALPWRPYRTIACWYLWHSRDQVNNSLNNHWS